MKISDNFLLSEFVQEGRDITPIQVYMLNNLCLKILEPIRNFLNCKLTITSGMRFPSDVNRLRAAGYNPSETSDHLYGNVIRVKSMKKLAKYGRYYGYSVGACDFIPVIGAEESWNRLKKYFNFRQNCIDLPIRNTFYRIKIGQIILEKGNNSHWIHISNPGTIIYSDSFISKFINRKPFLYSNDNGRTYQIYKGD